MTTSPATPTTQPRTIAWAIGAIAVASTLWAIHVWQGLIVPHIATTSASLYSLSVAAPLLASAVGGGLVLGAALTVQHRRDHRLVWAPSAAAAWGALVATGLAFKIEGWLDAPIARLFADHSADWVAAVMGPIVEEPTKALVIVLIMAASPRQRTLIWGLILGLCTGLGFQLAEDVVYALRSALADPLSDVAGATGNATARMLASFWSHWLYSALMGIAIALLFTPGQQHADQTPTYRSASIKACSQILDGLASRLRRHPRAGAVACYATSYLTHGLWNLWGAMTPLAFGTLLTFGCLTVALLVNGLVDRH